MEWRKPLNTAVLEKDTSDDATRRHPDVRKDICGDVGLVSGVLEMGRNRLVGRCLPGVPGRE